jgi:hypothetical protein
MRQFATSKKAANCVFYTRISLLIRQKRPFSADTKFTLQENHLPHLTKRICALFPESLLSERGRAVSL